MSAAEPTGYRRFAEQALHYFIRSHEGIPAGRVDSPAAWRGDELSERVDDWRVILSESQLGEIERAVDTLMARGIPLADVTRDNFELPTLATEIQRWREEIRSGRGFVVVRGLPVADWDEERSALAYWGLGHHLGVPGAQNAAEELLGHVRDYGDSGAGLVRQYRTTEDIQFHCDAADVVGLLCLQTARSGGQSRIVSSVTVYNALQQQRPDLAHRLFQPFELDRRNEHGPDEPGHLPVQPCCFGADGVLRTFYHGEYFRSAQRHPQVQLDPAAVEALALYDALCNDPALHLDMWLERGDMQFISNHTVVHARSEFEDWPEPERKRHLLRLWLSFE